MRTLACVKHTTDIPLRLAPTPLRRRGDPRGPSRRAACNSIPLIFVLFDTTSRNSCASPRLRLHTTCCSLSAVQLKVTSPPSSMVALDGSKINGGAKGRARLFLIYSYSNVIPYTQSTDTKYSGTPL